MLAALLFALTLPHSETACGQAVWKWAGRVSGQLFLLTPPLCDGGGLSRRVNPSCLPAYWQASRALRARHRRFAPVPSGLLLRINPSCLLALLASFAVWIVNAAELGVGGRGVVHLDCRCGLFGCSVVGRVQAAGHCV